MLLVERDADRRRRHHRHAARPAGRAGRPPGRRSAGAGGLRRLCSPCAQPEAGVTYAHKIEKAEAAIDWPPGARPSSGGSAPSTPSRRRPAVLGGETLKVWRAQADGAAVPARRRARARSRCGSTAWIAVACGEGVLRLTELQRPGGKRLAVADFLRGFAASRPAWRFGARRPDVLPAVGSARHPEFRAGVRDIGPGGARHRRLGPHDRRGDGQVGHERDRSPGHDPAGVCGQFAAGSRSR